MMRVLGIVPARGGSKRVPRKNLRELGGRPLVRWAIDAARGAGAISRLVLSSDDDEVLACAAAVDPALPLRRPAELSTDTALAIDYVRHALAACEGAGDRRYDAITIIQPSSPFTLAEDIDDTLALLESSGADSAVTVMALDHAIHPVKLKRMEGDRLLPYLEEESGRMAAHELPPLFVRNCAVYASRRSVIEAGKIIGDDCRAVCMPRERSLDINDELDMELAAFMLARRSRSRSA
jgi:CMP-N-acetylneuraminic acid synthetase